MLFQVTNEHDHVTCPGRPGGPGPYAQRDARKWHEDDVKVLGVWGHQPSHKPYAIFEASVFDPVTELPRGQRDIGKTEVAPVNDNIAIRGKRSHWGQ